MNRKWAASPLAVGISFLDCINRGDVDRMAEIMHPDFELRVFEEPPSTGLEGWRGYAKAFPNYLIHRTAWPSSGTLPRSWGTPRVRTSASRMTTKRS